MTSAKKSEKAVPLWKLVRRVSESYGRRLQEHKKKQVGRQSLSTVTVQQFQYLQAIQLLPSATVKALAVYFGVTAPTVTVLVQRLEEQGFVDKEGDSTDRRVQHLLLTEKGRRLLKVQEEAFKALADDIARILSDKEMRLYSEITRKICAAFESTVVVRDLKERAQHKEKLS